MCVYAPADLHNMQSNYTPGGRGGNYAPLLIIALPLWTMAQIISQRTASPPEAVSSLYIYYCRALAPSDCHTEDDSESESCLGLIPHQVWDTELVQSVTW